MVDLSLDPGQRLRSTTEMMIQREPKEVAQFMASGRWKKKHVLSLRDQFGDNALLDVLLCPFVNDCSTGNLTAHDCQQSAGALLLDIMPSCDAPLRAILQRSLSIWSLSVEEWPYYLCRCFGLDAVVATIDEIVDTKELDDTERRAVDAMRYWLRGKPDTILGASTQ